MGFFKMYFLAAALVSATLAQSENTNSTKVDVVVYYESLCPQSIQFFTNQIVPVMSSALKNNINMTLVPYGKTTITKGENGTSFSCDHGKEECYGNKVQACIVSNNSLTDVQLKVIECLMRNETRALQEYPLNKCANDAGLGKDDVDEIANCANSTKGDEWLEEMGKKTDAYKNPLTSVPSVLVKGVPDQNAIADLKTAVCSKLNSTLVSECKSGKNGASSYQMSTPILAIIAAVTLARF